MPQKYARIFLWLSRSHGRRRRQRLFDLGLVSTDEPFLKLFNQGMILAFAYEDAAGSKVPTDEVEEKNGTAA